MSYETKSEARLRAIDGRLTRLRAERERLAARVSHTERKRDTRRKILVGATVLAAVEHEGVPALRSARELLEWLDTRLTRPHDRTVFDLARRATPSTDV
jgi:large subunit ribosomal protein L7/L12